MPTRPSDFLSDAWRESGPVAWCLFPLTLLSHAYIRLAKLAYKWGWKSTAKLPVPVIVVGNVMVGGTGKTPIVMHLAQRLTQMGWQVG
ncbi:MAG: Tetraacyldisaccharide 4-kinase, partial [Pseudomonadota bacterium]